MGRGGRVTLRVPRYIFVDWGDLMVGTHWWKVAADFLWIQMEVYWLRKPGGNAPDSNCNAQSGGKLPYQFMVIMSHEAPIWKVSHMYVDHSVWWIVYHGMVYPLVIKRGLQQDLPFSSMNHKPPLGLGISHCHIRWLEKVESDMNWNCLPLKNTIFNLLPWVFLE